MFPPAGTGTGVPGAAPPVGGGSLLGGTRAGAALRKPPQTQLRKAPGDSEEVSGLELYQLLADSDPKGDTIVRRILTETRTASLEGRELMERGWWQKLLYINGRQWIYYTPRAGWQDKRLARWIPRPVTNITAETVQTIRSMLSGIEPSLRVRPNGQEPINVITAQMADDLEPVLNEEHKMQTRFFEADFWAPALGVAFLHPHWDRDSDEHQEFVQALACPQCGFLAHPLDVEEGVLQACPNDGTPAETFQPGHDENGAIGEYIPIGQGVTDVLSPLEVLIPTYCQRWEDVDRLVRLRWRPKSYYDGRPYAAQIQYSSSTSDRSLQMYRALALMNDLTTAPYQWGGAQPARVEGAVEVELWVKPSADYPEGLWARAVGGTHGEALIIHDPERGVVPGPLPYKDFKNRPLWCWVYYPYEEVGGRIWAKSALDSILQKQDQLNRNDSMVELIMQRMANPIWLEPKGSEVQRFTGEPGLIVRYQVVAGSQAKPERMEGMSPPQAFFVLRQQYLSDVERLAGTEDVLKGANPTGVEAFSALQLLVERSQSRFTSLFKARGRAYRDWYALALELERSYGPQLRTKSVMGQNRAWSFQQFKRQDLAGAITVVIEDGSTTPKTTLGKRAALQQAQQLGVLDPKDSDTAYSVLELLGVAEVAPGLDAHTKSAQMEQEQYEEWIRSGRPASTAPPSPPLPGQPPPPPPTGNPLQVEAWQNHTIHVKQHDQWANSDRIRALTMQDPQARDEITSHRTQHVIAESNPFGLPQPVPAPPPPPPVAKTQISLALKGADLVDPLVRQVLAEENISVQPAPAAGGAILPHGPSAGGQMVEGGAPPRPGGPPIASPSAPPGAMPGPPLGPAGPPNGPRPVLRHPARVEAQGAARALQNSNEQSGGLHPAPGHPTP